MKNILKSIVLITIFVASSCTSLVDGINDNPNDIIISDIDAELFLTGALLANISAQSGHMNRIAGMYTGQLIGFTSLYSNIYGFALSTAEAIGTWSRIYVGCIPNLRQIRGEAQGDPLLRGITEVVEAHAIGTAASLFGDVPYSEINDPQIVDPKFDDQVSVFNAAIALLDQAITSLGSASSRSLSPDIHFGGDAENWMAVAYTLKARYLLQQRDYSGAYNAAQNGISSDEGSLKYQPRGDVNISSGDKNLFWTILEGSRAGDIGSGNSFLMQLLDPSSSTSRNNAKTNETARYGYSRVDESGGNVNLGIISQFEAHNLVTFAENQLILAEAGARSSGTDTGLGHLNDLRAWLNTGGMVNENFIDSMFLYEAYDIADFENGGIENSDGLTTEKALLREIIEERYVSGFGMFMPYNDARRLRGSEGDIAVPYVLVDGPNPPYPERMPYSDDELNSNENAPSEDPGIFMKTMVNQ